MFRQCALLIIRLRCQIFGLGHAFLKAQTSVTRLLTKAQHRQVSQDVELNESKKLLHTNHTSPVLPVVPTETNPVGTEETA